MKVSVSASILSADFGRLDEAVALSERSGVDSFHIDVMDGHFVPNITIGPVVVEALRKSTRKPIKVHLMIEHPWDYLEVFAKAGADMISVQAECYGKRRPACRAYGQYPKEVDSVEEERLRMDLACIRGLGKRAGVVLNPGTPQCLDGVLDALDGVLVMSVNPGFSGQKFMPVALDKIRDLRSKFQGDIAVDGGINDITAPDAVRAGANVLITASYFFGSPDPAGVVAGLKSLGGRGA